MTATETLKDASFGNYMLNGLREISLPEPPSYFPRTIGWAILAGITLILLVVWTIQLYQHWQKNRYRRVALKRLQQLAAAAKQPQTKAHAIQELPVLLKQTALAAYPREQVAQLSGEKWLAFLASTYQGDLFTQKQCQLLTQLAYQPSEMVNQLSSETVTDLLALTHNWIAKHQEKSDNAGIC